VRCKKEIIMKKIEAIIRQEKLPEVRAALMEIGYPGMTLSDVKGHGKEAAQTQQWRGSKYIIELLPKTKIEIVVIDADVSKLVSAIVRTARTGEEGDGKIFVLPVESAIRIRTGDRDINAI
jgi:nitrogen regulatory protein P-II 1